DLDGSFHGHVPHHDVVQQGPVLDDGVVVVRRQEHVVVDVVGGAPRPPRGLEERRAPVPRPEVDRGAALEHGLPLVDHLGDLPSVCVGSLTRTQTESSFNSGAVRKRALLNGTAFDLKLSSTPPRNALAQDTGICLPGSTNGMRTTVAVRAPHSVSTVTVVPRVERSTGSHAYPMLRSSRGE